MRLSALDYRVIQVLTHAFVVMGLQGHTANLVSSGKCYMNKNKQASKQIISQTALSGRMYRQV